MLQHRVKIIAWYPRSAKSPDFAAIQFKVAIWVFGFVGIYLLRSRETLQSRAGYADTVGASSKPHPLK